MVWTFRHAALVASLCLVSAAAPSRPFAPVELAGGGVRLLSPAGKGGRLIAFGALKAATVAALTRALGRPPQKKGANRECGGGPQTFVAWTGSLTLWFAGDGTFVGWDSHGRLATAQGLALGSPRSVLRAVKGAHVEQSSLGTEFAAGALSGLLSSKGADAKVRALWSGSTCVFR